MNKIGFPLGDRNDGSSYVPINHFKRKETDKNQVQKEVSELIDKIEGKIPRKFGDAIKYILGELSDNIDNHSEFSYASLMAQYFPTKKMVDIAVFDNGITIPGCFEKHGIVFRDEGDAINKTISGEVTTKKEEVMRGYGLRSCKRLSTEGVEGELYIISTKGVLIFNSTKKPLFYTLDNSLKGTFLYFRLPLPKEKLDIYPFVV